MVVCWALQRGLNYLGKVAAACWPVLQVLIRWALQRGSSCLPKSANAGRIASNFDVFDWRLRQEDQDNLSNLPYRVSDRVVHIVISMSCWPCSLNSIFGLCWQLLQQEVPTPWIQEY